MSQHKERRAVMVTCIRCGEDATVLEGTRWAISSLCSPCIRSLAGQAGIAVDAQYRAIFTPDPNDNWRGTDVAEAELLRLFLDQQGARSVAA